MGKIFRTTIKDFSGGQSDDIRLPIANQGALIKHFDIFNTVNKLIPRRSSEADTNDGSTATGMKQYDVRDFQLGTDGKLYGMGKVVATGYPKIVSKADPTTGNWTLNATAEGNGARIPGCFFEWQGAWWFFQGTNQIGKWEIGGTVTNSVATTGTTITSVAQGIVGADNNLYIFYNAKVVRITAAGAVSDDVCKALPSNMRITSVARYGTYLAIGMAYGTTASSMGISKVFIWDMVTDTTISDVIDWGDGALMVLGNIEGRLIGVSDKYMSSALGLGQAAMVIRVWSGGGTPEIFKEIIATQIVTIGRFLNTVVIKDNKMYWVASVPFGDSTSTESTFKLGIWCFGRKNKDSNFALSLDTIEEGIDTDNFKIVSFGSAGNYWFINHSADGSITKTNDAATYAFTSIYESQKFGGGKKTNKLVGVSVSTESIPMGGSVTLKYKSNQGVGSAKSPGTVANNDGTGTEWSNPDYIKTNNNEYAATAAIATGGKSDYLDATNFGFSIPTNSAVVGVKVDIIKKSSVSGVVVIDSYSEDNANSMSGGSNIDGMGQAFVTTDAITLDSCKWYLKKYGSPTGTAVAKIYAVTGTFGTNCTPTGTALATSDTLDVSTLTTTSQLITFNFTGAERIVLSAATNYIVTFEYLGNDTSNQVLLGRDTTGSTHSGNGCYSVDDNVHWSSTSIDYIFYVYGCAGAIDSIVKLIVGGSVSGNNKNSSDVWLDYDETTEYGGEKDTWGLTLTPAIVNASNFGVRLQAETLSSAILSVDYISITVYYAASWNTIFTNSNSNSLIYEAVNIESTGETLPVYKEIEFRIESVNGAEIIEMSFDSEEISDNKYN